MQEVCGVVHLRLERAIEVGEGLSRAAEAHLLAEVIPPLDTQLALAAVHAALDRDLHPHPQLGASFGESVGELGPEGGDDACGLVAEDEGRLEGKVAVAAVCEVVEVGAAEGGVCDLDGGLAGGRRPERAGLDAEVVGTVTNGCGRRGEGHGSDQRRRRRRGRGRMASRDEMRGASRLTGN